MRMGEVRVLEAGEYVLTDPCYRLRGASWDAVCGLTWRGDDSLEELPETERALVRNALAAGIDTWDDGRYPVEVDGVVTGRCAVDTACVVALRSELLDAQSAAPEGPEVIGEGVEVKLATGGMMWFEDGTVKVRSVRW